MTTAGPKADLHRYLQAARELIDGAAGLQAGDGNLRTGDRAWWENYHDQLERLAQEASQKS